MEGPRAPKHALKLKLGPDEDKSAGAGTSTAASSDLSAPCAVNILLKPSQPHTPVSCSHTCCTCSASGLCLFRCPRPRHPTHFTSPTLLLSSLPERTGSDFEDFSASCLPEGMWSPWLIRGSPGSDCHPPPASSVSAAAQV